MAFLRSLFAGVSGLKNHQLMMDVIGNNIANVNTVGFKKGRVTFTDMFSQTLQNASQPSGTLGGKNPMQVGLGTAIGSIDMDATQGSFQSTGMTRDMAIQGSAFFIVNQGGKTLYTRDGNVDFDTTGKLVNKETGGVIQGRLADINGNIPTGAALQDIVIRRDITSPAKATTTASFAGNLDAGTAIGGTTQTQQPVYDSLGIEHTMTLTFTKTGINAWSWAASVTPGTTVSAGTIAFNSDGSLNAMTGNPVAITPGGGAAPMSVLLNVGVPSATVPGNNSGITQNSGGGTTPTSTVSPLTQDGWKAGVLTGVSVGPDGTITGAFSNNQQLTLAQIMLADFNNPSGLSRVGGNEYDVSGNSGAATVVAAGGNSTIQTGVLEQSNVDLADEFTKMITAQRGFQASARIITVSDQFLEEVVALKR
jgi:flagellar hook protein FlgE